MVNFIIIAYFRTWYHIHTRDLKKKTECMYFIKEGCNWGHGLSAAIWQAMPSITTLFIAFHTIVQPLGGDHSTYTVVILVVTEWLSSSQLKNLGSGQISVHFQCKVQPFHSDFQQWVAAAANPKNLDKKGRKLLKKFFSGKKRNINHDFRAFRQNGFERTRWLDWTIDGM